MILTDSEHDEQDGATNQSEWSHRRSAALLIAGGVLFWAIVLLILMEFGVI